MPPQRCIDCGHLVRDWEKPGGGSCPERRRQVGYDGPCPKWCPAKPTVSLGWEAV